MKNLTLASILEKINELENKENDFPYLAYGADFADYPAQYKSTNLKPNESRSKDLKDFIELSEGPNNCTVCPLLAAVPELEKGGVTRDNLKNYMGDDFSANVLLEIVEKYDENMWTEYEQKLENDAMEKIQTEFPLESGWVYNRVGVAEFGHAIETFKTCVEYIMERIAWPKMRMSRDNSDEA